jgi:predicted ferric reductase
MTDDRRMTGANVATGTAVVVPSRAGDHRRRARAARALLVAAGANVGVVLALALARAPVDLPQPGGLALWLGRITGLLAEVLVLGQLLLSARVPVLERAAGQDQLLRWHRTMAPLALVCVLLHPLLLAASYTASGGGGLWSELWTTGTSYLDASAGAALFLTMGAVSVRWVRARMPYESWYVLHLTAYAAVGLAFGHQLSAGSEVLHGVVVRTWWIAQLVVVVGAIVMFRVLLPVATSLRHRVRVEGVDRHAGNVVSVRLSGQDLHRLGAQGGQFFVWRFLTPRDWWRAHPFSLSMAPLEGQLRFTAREIGGGSRALSRLRPGTRVVVEGPYGVMTDGARTRNKAVLIGAGLGIAPMRALLADLPADLDTIVVHRAPHRAAAVLHEELENLAKTRRRTKVHLVAGPRGDHRDPNRPLGRSHLHRLVPDLRSRDVYVCGPPGMAGPLLAELRGLGVRPAQIHIESFEL